MNNTQRTLGCHGYGGETPTKHYFLVNQEPDEGSQWGLNHVQLPCPNVGFSLANPGIVFDIDSDESSESLGQFSF